MEFLSFVAIIAIIIGIVVIVPSVLVGFIPGISSPLKISISIILHVVAIVGVASYLLSSLDFHLNYRLYLIVIEITAFIYGVIIGSLVYLGIHIWRNRVGCEQHSSRLLHLGVSGGIVLLGWILSTAGFALLFTMLFEYDVWVDSYFFIVSFFFGVMVYAAIAGLLTYSGPFVWRRRIWDGDELSPLRFGVSSVITSMGWIFLTCGIVVLWFLAALAQG